jgi:hypothetical protein
VRNTFQESTQEAINFFDLISAMAKSSEAALNMIGPPGISPDAIQWESFMNAYNEAEQLEFNVAVIMMTMIILREGLTNGLGAIREDFVSKENLKHSSLALDMEKIKAFVEKDLKEQEEIMESFSAQLKEKIVKDKAELSRMIKEIQSEKIIKTEESK